MTKRRSSTKLPSKVSLRDKMPPVDDQGELGSSAAFGVAGILYYNKKVKRSRARKTGTWVRGGMRGGRGS